MSPTYDTVRIDVVLHLVPVRRRVRSSPSSSLWRSKATNEGHNFTRFGTIDVLVVSFIVFFSSFCSPYVLVWIARHRPLYCVKESLFVPGRQLSLLQS
jgi:hypothetical protein